MATKTIPITEARTKLPQIVKAAGERLERTVITSNGKPKAIIVSYEEYESWMETLDILSDPNSMKAIQEADKELAGGRTFSYEEVFGHKQLRPK